MGYSARTTPSYTHGELPLRAAAQSETIHAPHTTQYQNISSASSLALNFGFRGGALPKGLERGRKTPHAPSCALGELESATSRPPASIHTPKIYPCHGTHKNAADSHPMCSSRL